MLEVKLTETAGILRNKILADADVALAGHVSNEIIDRALDAFNEANTDIATSMLARALFARAMIHVASLWLNDLTKLPTPECFIVIESLVADPPPGLEGHCWRNDLLNDAARD